MASKQLGRLRQWAGEVISTREKAPVDDEFLELEKDVQLRREGIQRLMTASEAYHHVLSKTKSSEALTEEEKMLPVDSLGLVMIGHGEEFKDDSMFGSALIKLGRAHCKVATLQEAYALTFKDTFIASMERFKDEIKEYEALKKKLENRRTIYDSATVKFEKLQNSNSKKEKDRREAEDELERARQRYEETAEDMRAHTHAIQENEHNQHQELTAFLDLEMNFIQSYLDVLTDVKADWLSQTDPKRRKATNVNGQASAIRSTSRLSVVNKNGKDRSASATPTSADSSDDEDSNPRRPSLSNRHSRSGSNASRPPSRPSSRLSRKRKDSVAASISAPGEKEKEKEKEKESTEKPRKMSVTGWASSAVESVTGSRGTSKKSKDKEAFATLDDGEASATSADQGEDGIHKVRKSSSFRGLTHRPSKSKSKENLSTPTLLSQSLPKILKPPSLQDKKIVRAMYDFSGSSDELSFKTGNEIVVINEVLDDWWLGELHGQQGLFPASYTQPLGSKNRPIKANPLNLHPGHRGYDSDHDRYLASDADDEHIIGATPMAANKSPVFYGAFDDQASITDSAAESMTEDDGDDSHFNFPPPLPTRRPMPDFDDDSSWQSKTASTTPSKRSILNSRDPAQQPLINRSQSAEPTVTYASGGGASTPTKKIPPPPPPRRAPIHMPATPPIPERRLPGAAPSIISRSSHASSASLSMLGTGSASIGGKGTYDRSPFESAIELSGGAGGVCENFKQNPFKPKGMCSNCLEFHQ